MVLKMDDALWETIKKADYWYRAFTGAAMADAGDGFADYAETITLVMEAKETLIKALDDVEEACDKYYEKKRGH